MEFETLTAAAPESVWDALASHVRPLRERELEFERAAGLVLAQDVHAAHDYPPFDRAVMDGYAVRTADFDRPDDSQPHSTRLRVAGLLPAGRASETPLAPGTCVQINTGAAIPPGADAVVMIEHTKRAIEAGDAGPGETGRDHEVIFEVAPRPGQHLDRRATFVRAGDLLLRAGARLGPGEMAALAAGGVGRVAVFPHPQVALFATGDELRSPGEPLAPGEIPESNSLVLDRLARDCGAEPVMSGRCADEPASLRASLELGLSYDVMIVAGGMSKGTHDLVPSLLEELGVRWLVSSLNLKPGKPTRIGRAETGCWVLGLPGNPVSCAVCFLLFGRCLLQGLQGLGVRPPTHLPGVLADELGAVGERPMYQPGEWAVSPREEIVVTPGRWRGSGDPFGLVGANALIYRAAQSPPAQRGERVRFIPLEAPR